MTQSCRRVKLAWWNIFFEFGAPGATKSLKISKNDKGKKGMRDIGKTATALLAAVVRSRRQSKCLANTQARKGMDEEVVSCCMGGCRTRACRHGAMVGDDYVSFVILSRCVAVKKGVKLLSVEFFV